MHNFALALATQGHQITGSDDDIFEPSKSRLHNAGLLPSKMGWFAERVSEDIDLIILGMHAREDNPEIRRAKELGIPIYSFPAYTFEQAKNQKRIVVAGSHGKTTTTGMLMHVFEKLELPFDYVVGSQLDGYERMVQFSEAPAILIEGDEYLSSALDRKPKFLHYKPQLAMITGIAWDHINVFPTFENYIEQFRLFIDSLPLGSICYYNALDEELKKLCESIKELENVCLKPYSLLNYSSNNIGIIIHYESNDYPMPWFGKHNVSNMTGALLMATEYGIEPIAFLRAMQSFGGTARRLEQIYASNGLTVIRDFAHSPSKLKATTAAVKEQYADKNVIAVFELHTYSSLQSNFLPHYKNAMVKADISLVYIDDHVFKIKQMEPLTEAQIKKGFVSLVEVYNKKDDLISAIKSQDLSNSVLLLMSSGSFSGLTIEELL